jgi:Gas vesicle synthesis protein GvpL/GvpF
VIYLYAIAEDLDGLPEIGGVGDAPLRRRTVDGLDLVVSDHERADLEATEEAVLAHARVVDALVDRSGALLPARFGRGFRDDGALEEAIRARAAALRDALALVRGCVELGVRVVGEAAPSAPAASGRAYM